MKIQTVNDLLMHELMDLYSAEHQIIAALPKMAEKATDTVLKESFEKHLEETRVHVARLNDAASQLEADITGEVCVGMQGLLKEGEKLLAEEPGPLLDQLLIGAAQRVEHYEIAAYGCAVTYAQLSGNKPIEDLLNQTLRDEEITDESLSKIARAEQEELQ